MDTPLRDDIDSDNVIAPSKLSTLQVLLNVAAFCLICYAGFRNLGKPLEFDDAYMFYRYAVHLREGIGVSWNPGGLHTAGMTSIGWFLAIVPVSLFPLRQGQALAIESFAFGLVGIVILAAGTTKLARSQILKRFSVLFSLLILLLIGTPFFMSNMITGMDTMLSFTMNAALSCSIWAWCTTPVNGNRRSALVGLLGASSVIVRPENGLFAVLAPVLAAALIVDKKRRNEIIWVGIAFLSIIVVYSGWYRSYFSVWFPLSFHMKSQHLYRGYVGAIKWPPETYLAKLLLLAIPVLAFPIACSDRRSLSIGVTYLSPLVLTFGYLSTVTQIMGTNARYYVPFIAPIIVSAFWMSDIIFLQDWRRRIQQRFAKFAAFSVSLLFIASLSWRPIKNWSRNRLTVKPYASPILSYPSSLPLPEQPWFATISLLSSRVINPLPAKSVVAASEVGLIGAMAPQITLIDLAGLNDNDIALRGFSMDRLLDRKPLVIWFPHGDYTWQRQLMFCSPRLLPEYTVLGGSAFNYSIAIRRGTPDSAKAIQNVSEAFHELYPGVAMKDYIVSSITCI